MQYTESVVRSIRERAFFAGAIVGSLAGAAIVGAAGFLFALGIAR